jgi:hypothetical protein
MGKIRCEECCFGCFTTFIFFDSLTGDNERVFIHVVSISFDGVANIASCGIKTEGVCRLPAEKSTRRSGYLFFKRREKEISVTGEGENIARGSSGGCPGLDASFITSCVKGRLKQR